MNDPYISRHPSLSGYTFSSRQDPVIAGPRHGLTIDQRNFYSTNGYLIIDGFFNGELNEVVAETNRLFYEPPETAIVEPSSNTVRSVFAVHRTSPFDKLSRSPALLAIMEEITGGATYIHQSRINYKAPFNATGWMWHSDFETWHVEDGMPRMRCVTAMIPLTDNIELNGPLMVIPGSHMRFLGCPGETPDNNYAQHLKAQKVGVPDEASVMEFVNASERIESLTCKAGSLVLFDCNTMHGSNSNISPYWRKNLFFVYNSMENRLVDPFCGKAPRPEHVATRETISALHP